MPLSSILYVSVSTLTLPREEHRVHDIVATSRRWNASVGITGALIFTELHFAQYIEGPPNAVSELFAKIKRDNRHTDVNIVVADERSDRQFATWSLAYSGPQMFVEDQIAPVIAALDHADRSLAAGEMIRVMLALSKTAAD